MTGRLGKQIYYLAGQKREQLPELLTVLFSYLLLLILPLFVWRNYAQLTNAKWFCFLYLCLDYLLALLLVRCFRRGFPQRARFSLAEGFLLLFLLTAILSSLLSPYGAKTLLGLGRHDGLLTYVLLVLLALAVARFGSWRDGYLVAISIVCLLLSLLAILQLAGGNPLRLYPGDYLYADNGLRYSGRYLTTIGNVDLLSAYDCLMLPLLFGGTLLLRGWKRWLALVSALATLAVLLAADVSSGILALALTALLLLPSLLPQRLRKPVLLALCLLLLLFLLWLYFFAGAEQGIFFEATKLLHGQAEDSFGSSRIRIWREALAGVKDTPWLGSGPGTRSARFSIVFERYVAETGETLRSRVDSAHSEYLDYALETGLVGLAFYLAALAAALRQALRQLDNRRVLLLFASVLCYLIQACFNISVVVVSPLFFLLLGLLIACYRTRKEACGA